MSTWITGNETIPPTYLFDTPEAIERCFVEDFDNGELGVALSREGYPTERYQFCIPKLVFNGKTNPDSAMETINKMWGDLLPHQRFMLIKSLGELIIEPAVVPAGEGYPADYMYSTPDAVQRIDLVEFKDDILKIALIHDHFGAEYHDIEIAKLVFKDQTEGTSAKSAIDVMWENMIPAQRLELIQSLGKRIDTVGTEGLTENFTAIFDQMVKDPTAGIVESFEDALERAYWEFDAERKEGTTSERDLFKLKVRYLVNKY